MPTTPRPLPVDAGVVELTRLLCDIESVSGMEQDLADRVEATLSAVAHLEVIRHGNTVAARTQTGRPTRVLIAGHLDTVPLNGTLPARIEDGYLWGRGSVDMKGGVASHLIIAATLDRPRHDVTWVFYDQEEVDATRNGLGHFATAHPDWMAADFGILGEPSNASVEGGCNGTLRVVVTAHGVQAHSARPWMGRNAIHALAPVLTTLHDFQSETRRVDGLDYRESVQAVALSGGVAGNVVPDEASVTINYRFAPDRSVNDAVAVMASLFDGWEVEVTDSAPGARPGLESDIARDFVAFTDAEPAPKYGWTDVSRLSEAGIPAVNFGPGDPSLAHSVEEKVPVSDLEKAHDVLSRWLSS